MEHRWGRRQATDVTIRFVTSPAKIGTGCMLNISTTGAYLQTTIQLRRLSILYLKSMAAHPAKAKTKGMAACVVRRDADGVGLEWCEAMAEKMSVATRLALLSNDVGNTTLVAIPSAPAAENVSQSFAPP